MDLIFKKAQADFSLLEPLLYGKLPLDLLQLSCLTSECVMIVSSGNSMYGYNIFSPCFVSKIIFFSPSILLASLLITQKRWIFLPDFAGFRKI